VWGRYDQSFEAAEALAYRPEIPDAEVHLLDAGYFALDEKPDEVAALIGAFMSRVSKSRRPEFLPLAIREMTERVKADSELGVIESAYRAYAQRRLPWCMRALHRRRLRASDRFAGTQVRSPYFPLSN
jgi:hypothetical protein